MSKATVDRTVADGLCISCGACKGICPRESITFQRCEGMYVPRIDSESCIGCGLCADVCPGLGFGYKEKETACRTVTGEVMEVCNAWSRDPDVRHGSASGGVVTTAVRALLASGEYECVFCLDTYAYDKQLKTVAYTADELLQGSGAENVPRSRYLPVSHENAVRYIKENKDKRAVFIGTSCAVRALLSVIRVLKLERDNYLFIGLFCDKVFNYNVIDYFEDKYLGGERLARLHFKNKESGGWPGDMKLFREDGSSMYVPIGERGKVKEYFMPERCLYCVDKLNCEADISLGDNYTGKDSSSLGSNSVIIRTERGKRAWELACKGLEVRDVSVDDIQKAQYIEGRLNNLYFGDLKERSLSEPSALNGGVLRENEPSAYKRAYKLSLERLRSGAVYDKDPRTLSLCMRKDEKKRDPRSLSNLYLRGKGFLKRRIFALIKK